MGLSIVILDNQENFLQFLDPDLCTLVETHEKGGLRTLSFNYKFQNLHNDKQLFRIGNKVWVSGDTNLTDCLYVINTPVETDVYQENSFSMELEEVLVELNYAPLFSQTDLTSSNGFTLTTTNGQQSVTIDWNALNYWFGEYFNIGVVQKCLNPSYNKVALSGTMTLMSLLRYIEDETGNIFETRYEKDLITNTIHRYLDFLNPINVSKDWELNIEYDFVQGVDDTGVYDSNGDPSSDEDEYADTESEDDLVDFTPNGTPYSNVDPTKVTFRITDNDLNLLNSDGDIYIDDGEQTPLVWTNSQIGFDGTVNNVVINLCMVRGNLGLICNGKTFVVPASEQCGVDYGRGYVASPGTATTTYDCTIPDDSYFTIYDTVNDETIFKTRINREIGHTHEEILDFGFNIENVTFETDESDTFTAIAPIFTLDKDGEGLSKNDLSTLINVWRDISIVKGTTVPMIVQKVNIQAESLAAAEATLGTVNLSNNYWSRPFHPQDNIDSGTPANSTWEFWRATAYWKAPFDKYSGDLHITLDQSGSTEYTTIHSRPDIREERDITRPKIGNMDVSAEDIWVIYNEVCMKLKDKMYPNFSIDVDVANLRDGRFNQYSLHDKVYVKLPDYPELLTARVSKTSKEAHDIAKNTIELDNYGTNTIKNVQNRTYIQASNASFKYPATKDLTIRLVNEDYDSDDPYSVAYPANKLITFALYNVSDNSSTLTNVSYTKLTNAYGYATISMQYDPGDYKLEINFGGDEEYDESRITIDVNVSGVKEVTPTSSANTQSSITSNSNKTSNKVTTSSNKNTTTKKRYYTKYGESPDGKYLMAIGRASASGELAKYGYGFYKTVFKKKCPMCGSKELYWSIFWAGNESGNWGKFPATGRKESGSAEGQIFCKKCDADYSVFGKNHNPANKDLKVFKKAVKSTKTDAYALKKGKMYYDSVTVKVPAKEVTSTKTRTSSYTQPNKIKQQALSIVGNSVGIDAAKKIAKWCSHKHNLAYANYPNFQHKPVNCLDNHRANCCDSTRLMLSMMDAAGCSEKLKLQYVHCHNSAAGKGHVFAKITTRSSGKWRYVDPVLKWENGRKPWENHLKGYGPVVAVNDYSGPNSSPF